MPQVQNPHSAAEARRAALQGMTQVEANTDAHWKSAARAIALSLARSRNTFTTDDIWSGLSDDNGMEYQPHDGGAMGPLMRELADEGFIRTIPNGKGVQKVASVRKSSHGRYITLWQSLVHYGTEQRRP